MGGYPPPFGEVGWHLNSFIFKLIGFLNIKVSCIWIFDYLIAPLRFKSSHLDYRLLSKPSFSCVLTKNAECSKLDSSRFAKD